MCIRDRYIQCEECRGLRYNRETLEITYKGKTISEILELSIEEAAYFFSNHPAIKIKLESLSSKKYDLFVLIKS